VTVERKSTETAMKLEGSMKRSAYIAIAIAIHKITTLNSICYTIGTMYPAIQSVTL
jgi:hypothetical protein